MGAKSSQHSSHSGHRACLSTRFFDFIEIQRLVLFFSRWSKLVRGLVWAKYCRSELLSVRNLLNRYYSIRFLIWLQYGVSYLTAVWGFLSDCSMGFLIWLQYGVSYLNKVLHWMHDLPCDVGNFDRAACDQWDSIPAFDVVELLSFRRRTCLTRSSVMHKDSWHM